MGSQGKDHRAAAERLRSQSRAGIWRYVRLVPAANESRNERRAQALCLHHRQERRDSVRGEQRRREAVAEFRQDQNEIRRAEMMLVTSSEVETSRCETSVALRGSSTTLRSARNNRI